MSLCPSWPVRLLQQGLVSSLLNLVCQPRLTQSIANSSGCWSEGHWIKPLVSIYHFYPAVAYLWCRGVLRHLQAKRILHPLFAILFSPCALCKWQEGITDLWNDCPMLVLTARPQLARISWNPAGEMSCCLFGGLGRHCGNLPRPDLAKSCLEITPAAWCFLPQHCMSSTNICLQVLLQGQASPRFYPWRWGQNID